MISKIKINFLISYFLLFTLFSGCKPIDSDHIYKKCIVDRTQKKLTEGYGIDKDIFSLLEEAEISLIERKIIENKNKESYLKLSEMAFNDDRISKKITACIKTNVDDNFFGFLSLTTSDFYSACPEEVYNNENDDAKKIILRKKFTLYANLMADGYKNEIKIVTLINESENFSKTERLILLHLILMNVSN